jgi:2-polyprenyl-3-methyl-5-hydroxy-6-metoxy-1,4-benzoquinol methylase
VTRDLLQEQLTYYSARAQEYDESVQQTGRFDNPKPPDPAVASEWGQAVDALHALGPWEQVLELACGTGLWTKELLRVSRHITALDGSTEMLAVNRAQVADPRVRYLQADLFQWKPEAEYDLVFFAFWLSHVPRESLQAFLHTVYQAVRPGGSVFIVDEPPDGRQLSGPVQAGQYQTRTLYDGRKFQIVKVYYSPQDIQTDLEGLGFEGVEFTSGEYYFHLTGNRRKEPC